MAPLSGFPLARLARGADAWLLRRGFSTRTLRAIALCEIGGCAALILISLALLALPLTRPAGLWLFWFSLGAALGTANFIVLVISGQRIIRAAFAAEGRSRSSVRRDVAGIMLKLLVTAILFCAAAAVFRASVVALLAGFTLPLAVMLVLGLIFAKQESD